MENHEIVPHKKNEILTSNKSLEKRGLDLIKDLSGSSQTNTGQLDLSKTIINETALQTDNDLVISLGRGENMVFKYIPAGEFLMGGVPETNSTDNDNQPFHKVFLDDYWIGKYPVTIQQYSMLIKQTALRDLLLQRLCLVVPMKS